MRPRLLLAALLLAVPAPVQAFCGFYVAGAETELFNDSTNVVLMRHENTTVLSMQNDYRGPPEDFAMVIPVPVVLSEDEVKTLPRDVFERVDRLAAPRLVEYWEVDPCGEEMAFGFGGLGLRGTGRGGGGAGVGTLGLGVTVEAEFAVGEYDIVILSAEDSSGLETWLRQNDYRIPEGAAEALRPYVEADTKFFVARVDVERVTFEDGRALLSPLRVHYDSESFGLPVRLGMLNSSGAQDLVVHILAVNQRFEVANYENVTIPTNLDVSDATRERFGAFYTALFDATLERNPGAVVTEYSWQASSCDPCPGGSSGLSPSDIYLLGADTMGADAPMVGNAPGTIGLGNLGTIGRPAGGGRARPRSQNALWQPWILTRLHHRYDEGALSDDLVFRPADPIIGGREVRDEEGQLSIAAQPAESNNFQGRYAIRHTWEGPIECDEPVRGRWGGPWPSEGGDAPPSIRPAATAATDRIGARGGEPVVLASILQHAVPALGLADGDVGEAAEAPAEEEQAEEPEEEEPADAPPAAPESSSGCGCRVAPASPAPGLGLLLLFGLVLRRRR